MHKKGINPTQHTKRKMVYISVDRPINNNKKIIKLKSKDNEETKAAIDKWINVNTKNIIQSPSK